MCEKSVTKYFDVPRCGKKRRNVLAFHAEARSGEMLWRSTLASSYEALETASVTASAKAINEASRTFIIHNFRKHCFKNNNSQTTTMNNNPPNDDVDIVHNNRIVHMALNGPLNVMPNNGRALQHSILLIRFLETGWDTYGGTSVYEMSLDRVELHEILTMAQGALKTAIDSDEDMEATRQFFLHQSTVIQNLVLCLVMQYFVDRLLNDGRLHGFTEFGIELVPPPNRSREQVFADVNGVFNDARRTMKERIMFAVNDYHNRLMQKYMEAVGEE